MISEELLPNFGPRIQQISSFTVPYQSKRNVKMITNITSTFKHEIIVIITVASPRNVKSLNPAQQPGSQ
jgi:hypothetical protein